MNREPELSIIVPVYNVEEYLEDCIQSILNQTYQDYEILLIDDGSIDSSGRICDSFTDERIRIFHIENGGVSNARNVGLNNAKGQFITFIDPDDMYGDNLTLSEGMKVLTSNLDIEIVQFPTYLLFDGSKKKVLFSPPPTLLRGKEIFRNWYRFFDIYNIFCWNKIYRKELLDGVFFPEGKIAEDSYFCALLMEKATCICTIATGRYLYRQRSSSLMKSPETRERLFYDTVDFRSFIVELSEKHDEITIDRLDGFMNALWGYMECRALYPKLDYSTIRKRLYSYNLKFRHIKSFSTTHKHNRKTKHLWAFWGLKSIYETLYLCYLRYHVKKYKHIHFTYET